MLIDTIVKLMEENGNFNFKGTCIDCKKEVLILVDRLPDSSIKVEGGAIFEPPEMYGYENKYVCKCDNCYQLDDKVHQITEIYTRCVGYYRPTSQMNPGKLAEIEQRKMFNMAQI